MVSQKKQKPKAKKPVKAQASQIDVSQLQIKPQSEVTGINIIVSYAGHPVHAFTLSVAEFGIWKCMAPDQKILYVRSKTNHGVFANDKKIINMVIRATINLLDLIFARAQQAQAQRRVQ